MKAVRQDSCHLRADLEQNFLGVEKRRWILADGRNLPVATSRQASLGLHYDRGNWLAGLEGFYKEVDGITTDTQGFQNEDQFNGEIGNYRVSGVEALLNYKSEAWSTWLSYTWNHNNYHFPDLDPATFPNNPSCSRNSSARERPAFAAAPPAAANRRKAAVPACWASRPNALPMGMPAFRRAASWS